MRAKAVLTDDDGATTLGEVADERLRSRGVRPDDARWTATREGTHPWIVRVEFEAAERPRVARWSLEPRGGFVTALDDEARWLGLPEDDGGPALAGVSSLPPHRSNQAVVPPTAARAGRHGPAARQPVGTAGPAARPALPTPDDDLPDLWSARRPGRAAPEPEPAAEPSAAVVDIGARRGGSRPRMPSVKVPDSPADLDWEGPQPVGDHGPGTGRRAEAGAAAAPAAETSPADNPAPRPSPSKPPEKPAEQAPPKRPAAKRGRKSRAQVPSWDEIVFGSRPEV